MNCAFDSGCNRLRARFGCSVVFTPMRTNTDPASKGRSEQLLSQPGLPTTRKKGCKNIDAVLQPLCGAYRAGGTPKCFAQELQIFAVQSRATLDDQGFAIMVDGLLLAKMHAQATPEHDAFEQ